MRPEDGGAKTRWSSASTQAAAVQHRAATPAELTPRADRLCGDGRSPISEAVTDAELARITDLRAQPEVSPATPGMHRQGPGTEEIGYGHGV